MGIKLSISNIAWKSEQDKSMYAYLQKCGYQGLEIAPSRLFGQMPYEDLNKVKLFREKLSKDYDLNISSIQSIWFGRKEKMFSSIEERDCLKDYTKKAILFAEAIGAGNLVFGCPKNRIIYSSQDYEVAIRFFRELGDYAYEHNTVLAMEANPVIYGTNYINETHEALKLINIVNSKGFKLNMDFGTVIENQEEFDWVDNHAELINHVHISEPYLNVIEKRDLHCELIAKLKENNYNGYISIEMKIQENVEVLYKTIDYLKSIIEE